MDRSVARRSFKHLDLAFSLLVFGLAVCGAYATTRARDPFAAVPEPRAKSLAARLMSGGAATERCPVLARTRRTGDFSASDWTKAPLVVEDRTVGTTAFLDLPIALQLQQTSSREAGGWRLLTC
jgi:hypothetical protein